MTAHTQHVDTGSNLSSSQAQACQPHSSVHGVAVGALLCSSKLIDSVYKALSHERPWIKKNQLNRCMVCRLPPSHPESAGKEDCFAIRLNPTGAEAMMAGVGLGEDLSSMLNSGVVRFVPGFRYREFQITWPTEPSLRDWTEKGDAKKFRFIELFAGIGGFRIALEKLGGQCVFASEINSYACEVYKQNFHETPDGDITDVHTHEIPPHDILTAGFPCQSFSRMGQQRGFEDQNGNLFWEIIRIARHCRPRALLLENVKALRFVDGGAAWATIQSELRAAGYDVRHHVLNSKHILPQRRARLYIVGLRADLAAAAAAYRPPRLSNPAQPADPGRPAGGPGCVGGGGGGGGGSGGGGGGGGNGGGGRPPVAADVLEADGEAAEWLTLTDRQWEKVSESAYARANAGCRLVQLDGPTNTITSHYKTGWSMYSQFVPQPGRNPRFLSVRETLRLQGFPDTFSIDLTHPIKDGDANRLYGLVGNAVNPPVVEAVARCILAALDHQAAADAAAAAGSPPPPPPLADRPGGGEGGGIPGLPVGDHDGSSESDSDEGLNEEEMLEGL